MVHNLTGFAELMQGSMLVGSITIEVPADPSLENPAVVTIAMGSVSITSKKR
jgi:hypothetical protein